MNAVFPPVGYIICRSSDGSCYIQISRAAQITVFFKESKCVFDGVTPSIGHPFLAKWSPNGNACCFMGEYKGMPRLIIIYIASDGKAGLDAWNLGTVPDRVVFKEREGMSDLCVPIIKGEEIFKGPFYYDDSMYEFKYLIRRSLINEYPSPSAPHSSSTSSKSPENKAPEEKWQVLKIIAVIFLLSALIYLLIKR